MDKKSLLAIVLSIFILVAYQEFISYLYPPPPQQTQQQPSQQETQSTAPSASSRPQQPDPAKSAAATQPEASSLAPTSEPAPRDIVVDNDVYTAIVTTQGARLKSLRLKNYPGDEGKDSLPLEMVKEGSSGEIPLVFSLEGKDFNLSDESVRYETTNGNLQLQGDAQGTIELKGKLANGTPISKTLTFSGQTYGIDLVVQTESAPATTSFASLLWTHGPNPAQNSAAQHQGPVALVDRKFVYESATDLDQDLGPGHIRWGGYADTYFLSAIIPPDGETHHFFYKAVQGTTFTKITIPWKRESREPIAYTLYVGPKDFATLNAVHPMLDRAIDFGWFHFIARPLVHLLRLSHSFSGNYGLDIILLTFLVKLVFFPLSNKSFKSMAQMREVQPVMERLREQYKDDREKLNKEMMELYRRYKINPLGGCLPMLVQMPVFVGLYQALSGAIELRQAPFFGWIQDLSQPDRLGSLDLLFIHPPGIPVLTLLMGATMFAQQAMTPMSGDPTQQKMMMLMPVIFTVMFVNFPAGLVLYWLVNNVLSIAQQYAYQKGLV